MIRICLLINLLVIAAFSSVAAEHSPEFSVAGFYWVHDSGRVVSDFNVGWRFFRADVERAESVDFDDSAWDVVCTPHTVELMPVQASGSRNYQGVAWYRKHFSVSPNIDPSKRLTLYFEAVMGRSQIYLNGVRVGEHLGGYLPFSVDLTAHGVKPGDNCLIALMTDNSDDKSYPPGKPQATLDFAYHGGIYRDVWFVETSSVHVTDPNKAGRVASGGVFVHYGQVNREMAEVFVDTDVANSGSTKQSVTLESRIVDPQGRVVKTMRSRVIIGSGASSQNSQKIVVDNPRLWSPDSPELYRVEVRIIDSKGVSIDGVATRIGLRWAEFRGQDGFWLNGEQCDKLIGGNRHQDYAYVGNAVPNSQHWRDAKRLRDAGCRIIRVAHYPQDPSFMDACDELGMFVIVATPGWQFWNKEPSFAELVYDDIRNMIRRDRNHPCVLMWEPILNETRFPLQFSLDAHKITHDEYPYSGCFCVGDSHSAGVADNYEVVYGWPTDSGSVNQSIFTREFGENVDDWYAHNNNNRASRGWGEWPQLVQAAHLAKAYNEMYGGGTQFIGGALWHPFDHQRGYHPDPYWGGIMDAFRQPKYAYYLFQSQVSATAHHPIAQTGPMVYIAHEISPFSPPDVTVFTNCDQVRLIVYQTDTLVLDTPRKAGGMPNPPVIFKDVYDFNKMRIHSYVEKNWQRVRFEAQGIIDGKVVCSTTRMPSRRSTKLTLRLDNEGQRLVAGGSDFIPLICEVTDDSGNVRRLAGEQILFTVSGEGEIIGDDQIGANPRVVEFGSAPVLIRSTLKVGKIRVDARVLFEGEHAPTATSIEFESIPSGRPMVYTEIPTPKQQNQFLNQFNRQLSPEQRQQELQEVERQQTEFGEKPVNQ